MSRVPTRERDEKSWQRGGGRLSCRLEKVEIDSAVATEPASRVERARDIAGLSRRPLVFCGRPGTRVIIKRSSAASSAPWPKARWLRWMIALAPVESRRSLPRPRHGWCRWRAGRPANRAIPSALRSIPGSSPACHLASMDPRRDMRAATGSLRAQCARSSTRKRWKLHKVRYYLEQRDPDFAEKMAEVLCVYRRVKKSEAGRSRLEEEAQRRHGDRFPTTRSPAYRPSQRPPPQFASLQPGVHATFAREHEYKRHGTISLLAGRSTSSPARSMCGQGSPSQPRIHRIPQASRRRLSGPQ